MKHLSSKESTLKTGFAAVLGTLLKEPFAFLSQFLSNRPTLSQVSWLGPHERNKQSISKLPPVKRRYSYRFGSGMGIPLCLGLSSWDAKECVLPKCNTAHFVKKKDSVSITKRENTAHQNLMQTSMWLKARTKRFSSHEIEASFLCFSKAKKKRMHGRAVPLWSPRGRAHSTFWLDVSS